MRRHCRRKWGLSFWAQTIKERTYRGRRRKEQREEEEGKIGFLNLKIDDYVFLN